SLTAAWGPPACTRPTAWAGAGAACAARGSRAPARKPPLCSAASATRARACAATSATRSPSGAPSWSRSPASRTGAPRSAAACSTSSKRAVAEPSAPTWRRCSAPPGSSTRWRRWRKASASVNAFLILGARSFSTVIFANVRDRFKEKEENKTHSFHFRPPIDRKMLELHLKQAERHVAVGQGHVSQQRDRIAQAANLSSERFANFQAEIDGHLQCPHCWIEQGTRSRLNPIPGTAGEDM